MQTRLGDPGTHVAVPWGLTSFFASFPLALALLLLAEAAGEPACGARGSGGRTGVRGGGRAAPGPASFPFFFCGGSDRGAMEAGRQGEPSLAPRGRAVGSHRWAFLQPHRVGPDQVTAEDTGHGLFSCH